MIRRELTIFLMVGLATVGLDYVTYRTLLWSGLPVAPAKAASFLLGTAFAYLANRFWTFSHKQARAGSALRFAILYAGTLGLNVLVNATALFVLASNQFATLYSFLLATAVSATVNFLGMKLFVFNKPRSVPLQQ